MNERIWTPSRRTREAEHPEKSDWDIALERYDRAILQMIGAVNRLDQLLIDCGLLPTPDEDDENQTEQGEQA